MMARRLNGLRPTSRAARAHRRVGLGSVRGVGHGVTSNMTHVPFHVYTGTLAGTTTVQRETNVYSGVFHGGPLGRLTSSCRNGVLYDTSAYIY